MANQILDTLTPATVRIPSREIRRLALLVLHPRRYIERRCETAVVESDKTYSWSVRHQVRLPELPDDDGRESRRSTIVSLGLHSKARLPDLEAFDPSGRRLSILSRHESGYVLALLFVSRWARSYSVAERIERLTEEEARRVLQWLAVFTRWCKPIIELSEEMAVARIRQLQTLLWRVSRINAKDPSRLSLPPLVSGLINVVLQNSALWTEMTALATTRHVLAYAEGRPNESLEFVVKFTDRIEYERRRKELGSRDQWFSGRRSSILLRWIDRLAGARLGKPVAERADFMIGSMLSLLMTLGLLPLPVVRRNINADHCESFYLDVRTPIGVETVRFYWRERENRRVSANSTLYECEGAVITAYNRPISDIRDRDSSLEVQAAPHPGLSLAALLSLLITVAASWIYLHLGAIVNSPSSLTGIVGTLQLFTLVPGGLVAGLAARQAAFASLVSRGPRRLALVLATLTTGLGGAIGLRSPRTVTEAIAVSASVVALASLGVFGAVAVGPRWRSPNCAVARPSGRTDAERRSRHRLFAAVYLVLVAASCYLLAYFLTLAGTGRPLPTP